MNDTTARLYRNEIANAEDNLYRAKMQQRAMPDWRSGNDEHIDSVVAGYQAYVAKLKAARDSDG